MTPRSRRKARKEAAEEVNFKFSFNHDGGQISTTVIPYSGDAGIFMKGFSQDALKHLKKSLQIAASASITMTAVWRGELFANIACVNTFEGFMQVLRMSPGGLISIRALIPALGPGPSTSPPPHQPAHTLISHHITHGPCPLRACRCFARAQHASWRLRTTLSRSR